jgi:lipoate-protein ligase A
VSERVWRWIAPNSVREPDREHMAEDERILCQVASGAELPTIRCYGWSSPTVTIGRLQDEAAARKQFERLPIYRRPSGGKAVEHGGDLTITVAAPHAALSELQLERGLLSTYRLLVQPVRDTLSDHGVKTVEGGNDCAAKHSSIASEDCFSSAARCDVLDAERGIKCLGSAMRRSSGALLLQMSLRPLGEIDLFGSAFLGDLRSQYMRYLKIGRWNIP